LPLFLIVMVSACLAMFLFSDIRKITAIPVITFTKNENKAFNTKHKFMLFFTDRIRYILIGSKRVKFT